MPRVYQNTIMKVTNDSSGLPHMKDRLLSCATRTSEKISKNPLEEESITFKRVNSAWDHFPTLLSVIRLVSLQTNMTYRGNFSKHPIVPETRNPAYMRTLMTWAFGRRKSAQATLLVCLSWDAL